MNEYNFTYRDARGGSSITKTYRFRNDAEALEVACLTFERFGVQVTRGSVLVGSFTSHLASGCDGGYGLILT